MFVWDPVTQQSQLIWILSDSTVCSDGFQLNPSVNYVFNYRGLSFARVRLSDDLYQRLVTTDTTKIDVVTQAAIFHDRYQQEKEIR